MHILRECKKYGCSLDSLHHFFRSLIIPFCTYGVSVLGFPSYHKFQKRAVSFGFVKKVSPVLSPLEVSDNRLWKSITSSTGGPLVDFLPPRKTRLLRNRGHSYVLPRISTERFKRLFNFI